VLHRRVQIQRRLSDGVATPAARGANQFEIELARRNAFGFERSFAGSFGG